MQKSIATIAAVSALTLALAGCSNEAPPEPTQAAQPTGEATTEAPTDTSGDWAFDHFGGAATFAMPPTEEPANEWAQDIIDYRTDAGLDTDLHWIDFTIDNMNGTEDVNINDVTIVTEDGEQLSSEPWLNDLISEAQDTNDDTDFYNRGVDISNSKPDPVKPGAKGEAVAAFSEPIEDAARIWITTPASSEIEAYPLP